MTRKKRTKLEMGHDAFLDIVANLVGILIILVVILGTQSQACLLYTSPSPRDQRGSRMPSSA